MRRRACGPKGAPHAATREPRTVAPTRLTSRPKNTPPMRRPRNLADLARMRRPSARAQRAHSLAAARTATRPPRSRRSRPAPTGSSTAPREPPLREKSGGSSRSPCVKSRTCGACSAARAPSPMAAFPGSSASCSSSRRRPPTPPGRGRPAPAYNLPQVGGEGPFFAQPRTPGAVPGAVFEWVNSRKLSSPGFANRTRATELSTEARSVTSCECPRN